MSDSSAAIDPKTLRRALGHFATGVAVVTTRAHGADWGITVNSFTSVSLNPPLVLWCLARSSRSYAAFCHAEHFAINVLAADQVTVSNAFAFREGSAFPEQVTVSRGVDDIPVIDGCCAYFQCRKAQIVDGGDHVILIGEVVEFETGGRPGLVYHNGQYAISESHPTAGIDGETRPPTGFLDSTVLPGLERMAERFEAYFETELKGSGVTAKEWRVLGTLLVNDDLAPEEIANFTLVSGSPLTDALNTLEDKNLIAAKRQRYHLTDAGRAIASDLSQKAQSYEAKALGPIDPAEAQALQRMLARLSSWIAAGTNSNKHS